MFLQYCMCKSCGQLWWIIDQSKICMLLYQKQLIRIRYAEMDLGDCGVIAGSHIMWSERHTGVLYETHKI